MKTIHALSLAIAITICLSACNTQAAPTVDTLSIQNTAIAIAYTMAAETYTAIPTFTIIPLTETLTQIPSPTSTPVILATKTPKPTVTVTTNPLASGGGNSYPCNLPLNSISGGSPTKIKIQNDSRTPIAVRLTLNKTPFGDCGFRDYTLGKVGSLLITDLIQGCYNITILIKDPNNQTMLTGYGCINNPDKWTFFVKKDSVSLQ